MSERLVTWLPVAATAFWAAWLVVFPRFERVRKGFVAVSLVFGVVGVAMSPTPRVHDWLTWVSPCITATHLALALAVAGRLEGPLRVAVGVVASLVGWSLTVLLAGLANTPSTGQAMSTWVGFVTLPLVALASPLPVIGLAVAGASQRSTAVGTVAAGAGVGLVWFLNLSGSGWQSADDAARATFEATRDTHVPGAVIATLLVVGGFVQLLRFALRRRGP